MLFEYREIINTNDYNVEVLWGINVVKLKILALYSDDSYFFDANEAVNKGPYCRLTLDYNNTKLWSSILYTEIYTKPEVILDFDHRSVCVVYGKVFYIFDLFKGELNYRYKYHLPIGKILNDSSLGQVFLLAETDVLCFDYQGKMIWSYGHRDLIVDILIHGAVLEIFVVDGKKHRLSIAKGTLYKL